MKVLNFDGEALSSVKSIKEVVKLVSDNEPKIVVFSSVAGVKEHLEHDALSGKIRTTPY